MTASFSRVLRANSRCREYLGAAGSELLMHAAGAITRILPHTEVSAWKEGNWATPGARWASAERRSIRITFSIGGPDSGFAKSLSAHVSRLTVQAGVGRVRRTLDSQEYEICGRIAESASRLLVGGRVSPGLGSLSALKAAFDEQIVAEHLRAHHGLELDVSAVLAAIRELAEQTYENKSLAFGCLLDPNWVIEHEVATFPQQMLQAKRYRALSDGFKTAYHVASGGHLLDFVDLEQFATGKTTSAKHYFPEWSADLARASHEGRCGVSLTRNGELLVFDEGSLRFSYRFGRWQYWNHTHLIDLLRNLTRVQRVPPALVGRVASGVYRAALDVSFRRTGALFVILRSEANLRQFVRYGDAIGDSARSDTDRQLDNALGAGTIQAMSRRLTAEVASLDGAVVVNNRGRFLAYGAVLQPRRRGRVAGTEGSRTKAAIGASHYGLAVKVSSDGDVTVYHQGKRFVSV